jgi:hypothetical protein
MPPGVDHSWAWADWLDVRVRVGGVSAAPVDGKQPKLKLVA